jgi:hypothetical protein
MRAQLGPHPVHASFQPGNAVKECPPRIAVLVVAAVLATLALMVAGGACQAQDARNCNARFVAW